MIKWETIKGLIDVDRQDVLSFGGLLLAGVGAGMIYLPAGLIVVGVGMMGIGLTWFIKLPKREKESEQREEKQQGGL